jgi:hypothetical protein
MKKKTLNFTQNNGIIELREYLEIIMEKRKMGIFSKRTEPVNRRREPRYVLPTLIAYTDENQDAREKLVNVSRNGCCLSSSATYNKDDHVLVHFIASDNYYVIEDSFCLDGKVVWKSKDKNNGHTYGMHFEERNSEFFENESRAFKDHVARAAYSTCLNTSRHRKKVQSSGIHTQNQE